MFDLGRSLDGEGFRRVRGNFFIFLAAGLQVPQSVGVLFQKKKRCKIKLINLTFHYAACPSIATKIILPCHSVLAAPSRYWRFMFCFKCGGICCSYEDHFAHEVGLHEHAFCDWAASRLLLGLQILYCDKFLKATIPPIEKGKCISTHCTMMCLLHFACH